MSGRTRIVFWTAICASCVWLAVAVAIGVAGVRRFFAGGFGSAGRSFLEILSVLGLTILPLAVLLLIVWAIRRRGSGRPLRGIARAFCPLMPAALLFTYAQAIQYLDVQAKIRRWTTGSITYVCAADYGSATADDLRLVEQRHPGKLSTWTVEGLRLTEQRRPGELGAWTVQWPGKKPIEAKSFDANTRSIGGSQGITWLEPDGRHMTAYLSFSDVLGEYGSPVIWISMVPGEQSGKPVNLDATGARKFTCGVDLASYRS